MASWLHFIRIGITWPKPFQVGVLDHTIDLLASPPRQVMAVVTAHARRHYDRALIGRLCLEYGWPVDEVSDQYRHGIDWEAVRTMLRGKSCAGPLQPEQRRGLELVISGGLWPEARRWKAGIWPTADCAACGCPASDEVHRVHDCEAMLYDVTCARAAGILPRLPAETRERRFSPLLARGLPPKVVPWEPVEVSMAEGTLGPEPFADIYGDGSGFLQSVKELRRASWAIIRGEHRGGDDYECLEALRGGVAGWFSTVPRGEITAFISFLRHSGPGARYITDCQAVADAAAMGVPGTLLNASSLNADLWRMVRDGIDDREEPPLVIKTKAHRSLAAARRDAMDHEGRWWGNNCADQCAKQLARAMAANPCLEPVWEDARETFDMTLRRIAFGVSWALKHWPELEKKKNGPSGIHHEGDQDTGHILCRRPDGAVECTLCRRVARSENGARRLARETCGGSIVAHIDESHALRITGGVTWCNLCGAFTSRWPRALLDPCRRRPWPADRRNVLRRLRQGLPPSAAEHFSKAIHAGGAPSGVPDHAGETAWRGGRVVYDNGSPLSTSTMQAQLAQRVPEGIAKPPTGIYSRLPANTRGGTSQTAPSSSPLAPAATIHEARQRASPDRHCSGQGNWGGRVRAVAIQHMDPCHLCRKDTISCCRGCGARLCVTCARARRACSAWQMTGAETLHQKGLGGQPAGDAEQSNTVETDEDRRRRVPGAVHLRENALQHDQSHDDDGEGREQLGPRGNDDPRGDPLRALSAASSHLGPQPASVSIHHRQRPRVDPSDLAAASASPAVDDAGGDTLRRRWRNTAPNQPAEGRRAHSFPFKNRHQMIAELLRRDARADAESRGSAPSPRLPSHQAAATRVRDGSPRAVRASSRPRGNGDVDDDHDPHHHPVLFKSRQQMISELSRLSARAAAEGRGSASVPRPPQRQPDSANELGGCQRAAMASSRPRGEDDVDAVRSDDDRHPHRHLRARSSPSTPPPAGSGGKEASVPYDVGDTSASAAAPASVCSVSDLHEVAAAAARAAVSTRTVVTEAEGLSEAHNGMGVAPPGTCRVSR